MTENPWRMIAFVTAIVAAVALSKSGLTVNLYGCKPDKLETTMPVAPVGEH